MRQGKDVNRFDLAGIWILKLLRDLNRADEAAHGGMNICMLERHGNLLLLNSSEKRARAGILIHRPDSTVSSAGDDPEFVAAGD